MSSKTKNTEKRELELRQQRAETIKAEFEAEAEKIKLARFQRSHREDFEANPEAQGIFTFYMKVDEASCSYFADKVQRYSHLNPGADITIYIQTPGGSVLHGLGLYDTLRTLSEKKGHKITTVVRGYAASFGTVLLQAGDLRLMGAEAHLMLHEISSGSIGKLHEMENEVEFCTRLNKRMFGIIADRTNGKWNSSRLYSKAKARDWWVDSSTSVSEGFADGIG